MQYTNDSVNIALLLCVNIFVVGAYYSFFKTKFFKIILVRKNVYVRLRLVLNKRN